jgi:uncharacterized repeat protein (TIGR03803 family)
VRIIMALGIASAVCGLPALSPASAASTKFKTLYSFGSAPNDGVIPVAALIAVKGMLYGTTESGGPHSGGSVYAIDPKTGNETTINNPNANGPTAPVTLYEHNLYVTTTIGVNTIFSVDLKTKQVTTLYNFPDDGDDEPASPNGLTEFNGKLFGTTYDGGRRGCGNVFAFNPVGDVFSILHTFDCPANGTPIGELAIYQNLLYGVTQQGGASNAGIIYSVDPTSGAVKTVHTFDGTDGDSSTGITFYKGVMYGSAAYGGATDSGTLFTFNPATRQFTTLFSFPGGAGGCEPIDAPIMYKGMLYGVAYGCSPTHKYGVLYKVSLATGEETVLHRFTNGPDGGNPNARLLLYGGELYGTTMVGGTYNEGTVFRYAP